MILQKEIRKTFFITKILKQERTNDSVQVLMLHLIEDIGYESNLFNVNRYYEGKGSDIIKKIVGEYLQTGLATDENDFQKFNTIYSKYLEGYETTRTTIEVGALPTPISVEFKVVAKK